MPPRETRRGSYCITCPPKASRGLTCKHHPGKASFSPRKGSCLCGVCSPFGIFITPPLGYHGALNRWEEMKSGKRHIPTAEIHATLIMGYPSANATQRIGAGDR